MDGFRSQLSGIAFPGGILSFDAAGEENRAEKTSQVWEDECSREFGLNWLEHSDMFEAELSEWN